MACNKIKWKLMKLVVATMLCGTIVVLLVWLDKPYALEDLNSEVPAIQGPEAVTQLRQLLIRLTYEDCEVLNWAQYDPVMPDTPLLLVTVHYGVNKIRSLIRALQQVSEIKTVLLIFSHSYYDPRINDLVRSIRFCKVMQIFYPYSVQAYPDQFPGVDPNDCGPDGVTPEGCVKRDARRAEIKHHWWWSTRFVFESLEWSGKHRGMVVFLKEDSVVKPGLLLALRLAERALIYFPKALLVWLAPTSSTHSLLRLEALHEEAAAFPALNATAWRRLNSMHSTHFCMYNDSSWRYSLLATVRMGGWIAVHADTGSQLLLGLVSSSLLPNRLVWLWGRTAPPKLPPPPPPPRPPGGFSDVRDQLFCLDPNILTLDSFTFFTDKPVTDKTLYYNFTSLK